MKRCIFHVPYPIKKNGSTGSQIRPRKILDAFQRNFDEVFVISGYGEERKQKFKELKNQISGGKKYDFMYSESSTMPTLLTEKNHMPKYPFLERNIFRFCKKHQIPIGLFYRDIYWKFPLYKKNVSFFKRCISVPLYKYDFYLYNRYVDILYLPTMKMGEYTEYKGRMEALPPGIEKRKQKMDKTMYPENEKLELFYVGGVSGDYDVTKLFEGVKQCDFVNLTLCCHKDQWDSWCADKKITVPENIKIIHEQGEGLEKYYQKADLALLFLNPEGYRKMAMPVKLFEYMEHQIPIIATKDCAAGDFVVQYGIGWAINFQIKDFFQILSELKNHKEERERKRQKLAEVIEKHTWDARVISVFHDFNHIQRGRQ